MDPNDYRGVLVTTWHLEQTDPGELCPAAAPAVPVTITRAEVVSPELNRFLYTAVGGNWHWHDRLTWTWRQWYDWLDRPRVETWVAAVHGTPCGYLELDGSSAGEVELAYFGLLPAFIGKGIGGHLLTVGLGRAWSLAERWPGRAPTHRVWVHTCSLDGPAALANYRARGLRPYRTETTVVVLPAEPPGPWPGADWPQPSAGAARPATGREQPNIHATTPPATGQDRPSSSTDARSKE